jgi:hypothetical protein
MRKSNSLLSWPENFPHARQKVTRGIYLFFIERVMRLEWLFLRERRIIKTARPPAAAKNNPPTAIVPLLPGAESSSGDAIIFVCSVEIFSGAEMELVSAAGFVGANGNGEFVTSNFSAGGGFVSVFVPIMMIECMTTRGAGGG